MHIHMQNLGMIKEAAIDLRPLTVFIGPNNTGKTSVAHAIGGRIASQIDPMLPAPPAPPTLHSTLQITIDSPELYSGVVFLPADRAAHTARTISTASDTTRPLLARYLHLATLLEHAILGHELVSWDACRSLSVPDAMLQPIEGASAMVKTLAPLVVYLRYQAQPNQLIILDEPEMHLHPEAQAKMTEFLALLVHAGLRVLITTHSPYIVDHLTNLMKAAAHPDPEKIQELFFLKQAAAFIPQQDVSVYYFNNGIVQDVLEPDGLIDWKTFSQVSERLGQLYFDIEEVG